MMGRYEALDKIADQTAGEAAREGLTLRADGRVVGFIGAAGVEAALVGLVELWRRSPGGGRWPFAGDGPWHLVSREAERGDYDARGGEGEAPPPRLSPLSREEVRVRDALSGWYRHVPERDRVLLVAAIEQLARTGRAAPDFMGLRSRFPNARNGGLLGADGLRKRYDRALALIARRVGVGASV